MRRPVALLGLLLLACLARVGPASAAVEINLLAFANGALVERVTSNYGSSWEAAWLTDENPASGWATRKGDRLPVEIVFSLPERSELTRLEFDTAQTESADRSAREVDILVSDQSATTGFVPFASVDLVPQQDGQRFEAPRPITGRWVKLVVKSNHGSDEYTEIMDVRAIGTQLSHTVLPDVSGTYASEPYGAVHLRQEGAQLTGCYETKQGLLQGGIEGQLMRLRWHENDDGTGPVVMVLARDGASFRGFWANDNNPQWTLGWDLRRVATTVGTCPHWNPQAASANPVTAGLKESGRIRLYGINFDTDKDTLRPDATPALQQILAALKANPGWRITIEGHTDATGAAEHNRNLSTRRATAVKTYLAAAGIAVERLETAGLGQDQPVASNDTAIGRAQNRRVELVKQ